MLDLDPAEARRPEFVEYFSGAKPLPGSSPLAQLYAGHQFGVPVPQLGDGRAVLLGEVENARGESWDVQLKGAGRTRFSRFGDGLAVLRSTIREYLAGEALHHLGIPTTRALCIVGSDDPVHRETVETAAVLTRLSPSHVRFGTFEAFAFQGDEKPIRILADYAIRRHFPAFVGRADKFESFYREVVRRTAKLMSLWQAFGFTHGVMNTDNMSVLGLTIDYGPYAFLDAYDPGFVPNHSDHEGRYQFQNQPAIALWNLCRFGEALTPLVPKETLQDAVDGYKGLFEEEYLRLMRGKLGFEAAEDGDPALVNELFALLAGNKSDYTICFRELGRFRTAGRSAGCGALRDSFTDREAWDAWAGKYAARLKREGSKDPARRARMDRANPLYILRSYMAQSAIEKAAGDGDPSEIDRLLRLLREPYSKQKGMDRYAERPPDWSKDIGLSCSS